MASLWRLQNCVPIKITNHRAETSGPPQRSRGSALRRVLGDACASGVRKRHGVADGGARVPEILTAAELEGFFAGVQLLESTEGASVDEDVKEAQELAMDATRGRLRHFLIPAHLGRNVKLTFFVCGLDVLP